MKQLWFAPGLALGLIASLLLPTTGFASIPPCGTAAQCDAQNNNCPAGDGWIYLTEKTVRCCLPTVADPREYYWFDKVIKVYNKVPPGQDERCYRRISSTSTGVRCSPVEPCVVELEEPTP